METPEKENLKSVYRELQESASRSLSAALTESSKVFHSVMTNLDKKSDPTTVVIHPPSKLPKPTVMDEFITKPTVPLADIDPSKKDAVFLHLIDELMKPHPSSPNFGTRNKIH